MSTTNRTVLFYRGFPLKTSFQIAGGQIKKDVLDFTYQKEKFDVLHYKVVLACTVPGLNRDRWMQSQQKEQSSCCWELSYSEENPNSARKKRDDSKEQSQGIYMTVTNASCNMGIASQL